MASKFFSERNLRFLLYEVFDATSLTQYDYYKEYDGKLLDMVLKAAMELAEGLAWPIFQEMDRNPPELVEDRIKVHPSVKKFLEECGTGGWIGDDIPFDWGGQQLPQMITMGCRFIFCAANYSAAAYIGLTSGAARLILNFGKEDLKKIYLPKMLSGKWQGTMALTEPEAGSSLSDITTIAEPTDHPYYKIRGQKIFISAGDHDAVENVVHLMLAKIKGAPAGVKGISLFVVPKNRLDEGGQLVSNDVVTSGIFHKLGYRGCPIAQLSIGDNDDCHGYLVGEPNQGLLHMFQMMNEARIAVGAGAAAIASAAYYAALDYSKTRLQGRRLSTKDPSLPQVPIIEHPDVKRMLLFQRSVAEGSLALLTQCAKYADLAILLTGEEKEKNELLLDLLTPVAKSYPSEMGLLSISAGLQCLGGSGYCDDYPLEQYYRDARIHPIHEGTTGIHGLDLLGRKVTMKNARAYKLYLEEVEGAIHEAEKFGELQPYARKLKESLEMLQKVTAHLTEVGKKEIPELFLADATLYLEFFGIICVAWQWLLQATTIVKALANNPSSAEANFYNGKFFAFRYFFEYELPKTEGLAKRLMNSDGLTVEIEPDLFSD
ncbi:MAG TPA: acyl-CoA dehydrogenase [Thermodesulfobacteriota bacterium]|jgi:butyryl-CoA dehydrogenase|nr:acyl-CoA dehydrogenase [Thermodesulfobacteriota bacterium]